MITSRFGVTAPDGFFVGKAQLSTKIIQLSLIVKHKIKNNLIAIKLNFIIVVFMTGNEFKEALKRLRVQQKQFALMNGMTVQGVNKWVSTNQIPKWAVNMLADWGKHPDLVDDNMRRAGLV